MTDQELLQQGCDLQKVNETKMTNESLLQQAKDQVADEMAGCTWARIEERFPEALSTHNFMMMHHAAAIRAIQSAREEGRKEGADVIGDAIGDIDYIAPHHKREKMYEAISGIREFLIESEEKLTAPGR